MTNRTLRGFLLLVFAAGLAGCDSAPGPGPTPPPPQEAPSPPRGPSQPTTDPAFAVADVTLSGVVYEETPTGRLPIAGVVIANGEGWSGLTDADGFFSFRPVWVCPCPAQPAVPAGTTSLWVGKDGFKDPEGLPVSRFGTFYESPGYRDVAVDGDTRVEFLLIKR